MQEDQPEKQRRVVILWDLIKKQLKPSESDQMAELLGSELIEQVEDLRDELENLVEITRDMHDSDEEDQDIYDNMFGNGKNGGKGDTSLSGKQSTNFSSEIGSIGLPKPGMPLKSILSETRNANFLDQELRFLIDNLQQKAVESGLDRESLIPKQNAQDKHIYEFITQKQRPQSGMVNKTEAEQTFDKVHGTPAYEKAKAPRRAPPSPKMEANFRSSFYSNGNFSAEDKEEVVVPEQARKAVCGLNIKNILELSIKDVEIVEEIKKFMANQISELNSEIECLQLSVMEKATGMSNIKPKVVEKEKEVFNDPTTMQMKDYAQKLKSEYLNTDKVLNIAKLPSLSKSTTNTVMREPAVSAKGKPVIRLKRKTSATRRQIAEEGSPQRQRGKSPGMGQEYLKPLPVASTAIKMSQQDFTPVKGPPKMKIKIKAVGANGPIKPTMVIGAHDIQPSASKVRGTVTETSLERRRVVKTKPIQEKTLYGLDTKFLDMSEVKKTQKPFAKDTEGSESPKTLAKRISLEQMSMDELRQQFGDSRAGRYSSPDRTEGSVNEDNLICTLDKTIQSQSLPNRQVEAPNSKMSGRLRGTCDKYAGYYQHLDEDQQ